MKTVIKKLTAIANALDAAGHVQLSNRVDALSRDIVQSEKRHQFLEKFANKNSHKVLLQHFDDVKSILRITEELEANRFIAGLRFGEVKTAYLEKLGQGWGVKASNFIKTLVEPGGYERSQVDNQINGFIQKIPSLISNPQQFNQQMKTFGDWLMKIVTTQSPAAVPAWATFQTIEEWLRTLPSQPTDPKGRADNLMMMLSNRKQKELTYTNTLNQARMRNYQIEGGSQDVPYAADYVRMAPNMQKTFTNWILNNDQILSPTFRQWIGLPTTPPQYKDEFGRWAKSNKLQAHQTPIFIQTYGPIRHEFETWLQTIVATPANAMSVMPLAQRFIKSDPQVKADYDFWVKNNMNPNPAGTPTAVPPTTP